jgi:hypothetical protein
MTRIHLVASLNRPDKRFLASSWRFYPLCKDTRIGRNGSSMLEGNILERHMKLSLSDYQGKLYHSET